MECQIEVNKVKCSCTYEPCSRKGKCCESRSSPTKPEVAGKANLGYITTDEQEEKGSRP